MKFSNPWIDPRVQLVRTADAQAYLLRHNWKPKPCKRPQVLLFEGPLADDGEPILQPVPVGDSDGEFVQMMLELVAALAIIEDRTAIEVLDEMLQASQADRTANGAGQVQDSQARREEVRADGKAEDA